MVALHVEIDEGQGAGAVAAQHPVGPAAEAGLVALDPRLDGDDRVGPVARIEGADRGRGAAVDEPHRQMPQQVDDQRARRLLDQAAELRPDAGQHRHRREQRVEKGGAHG